MGKFLWKLFRRSKHKNKKIHKAKESETGVRLDLMSTRTTRPAHFLFKIESFAKLAEILRDSSDVDNYESPEFECDGHKWKLSLYPNGNTKMGGDGYISLYLVAADAGIDSLDSVDIWAMFKLFVFDQKRDRYLTIEDGEVRRFHFMKKEWGFTQMLSLKDFKNAKNGYLVDDCCMFGVEILVIPSVVKSASFSVIENPRGGSFTWRINNFSSLNGELRFSNPFTVVGNQWKLAVRLGMAGYYGNSVSVFLYLLPLESYEANIYVECLLQFECEVQRSRVCQTDRGWFRERGSSIIWTRIPLSYLRGGSEGCIPNDTLVVEAHITTISKVVTAESE